MLAVVQLFVLQFQTIYLQRVIRVGSVTDMFHMNTYTNMKGIYVKVGCIYINTFYNTEE